jgi:hypothetical protein
VSINKLFFCYVSWMKPFSIWFFLFSLLFIDEMFALSMEKWTNSYEFIRKLNSNCYETLNSLSLYILLFLQSKNPHPFFSFSDRTDKFHSIILNDFLFSFLGSKIGANFNSFIRNVQISRQLSDVKTFFYFISMQFQPQSHLMRPMSFKKNVITIFTLYYIAISHHIKGEE